MKIKATCVFLEGRFRAEPGKVYEVADRIGGRLVGNGWADELPDDHPADETPDPAQFAKDAPRPPQDGATLVVADISHTVGG